MRGNRVAHAKFLTKNGIKDFFLGQDSVIIEKISTIYYTIKDRCKRMARTVNYEAKIETIEAKIQKKKDEIKKLKAELEEVKAKKAQADYKELLDYMSEHDISAEKVLDVIKN